MSQQRSDAVAEAVSAFADGDPLLVHDADDREGETDLIYPATVVTHDAVSRLRNDAGGLVCVALSDAVSETLALPFLDDAIEHPSTAGHDLAYDSRSSFSLPVNHRDTFTGVTDTDRALTISRLGEVAHLVADGSSRYGVEEFADEFRTPGHVNLLRGAPGLLADRRGHTELGLALAAAADLPPAVVVCEMLDDESGAALPTAAARDYADRHGFSFLEGWRVVEALA
ncbi:MAG: 3,4-dihydroxy-2-butanone-4-phosphate synthase [Halobacteriota archaeon]